jgi:hypothetical protein
MILEKVSLVEHETFFLTQASSQQIGVWFHALTHGSSYWNFLSFKSFEGNLNVDLLKQATANVIRRHSGFRTCFLMKDDKLWQKILKDVHVDHVFTSREFTGPFESAHHPLVQEELDRLANEKFDYENQPLFKFRRSITSLPMSQQCRSFGLS